jgi:subtilisin family serine protease
MDPSFRFRSRQGGWSATLQSLWLFLLLVLGCSTRTSGMAQDEAIAEGGGTSVAKSALVVSEKKAASRSLGSDDSNRNAGTNVPPGQREVWVVLKKKGNIGTAKVVKGWKAKGDAVYSSLSTNAKSSQSSLRSMLDARGLKYTPYWIVNAVKVTADDATIAQIAKRTDVARVFDEFRVSIPAPTPGVAQAIQQVEWNITNVRAPEAWDNFGTRGEGIVVGSIDTGAQFDHPALINQYRGHAADGTLDHNYNWFDPTGMCGDTPCDNAGHGTHTMGTIVGDDGGENQIGVAPAAKWITAKGCEDFGCSLESLVSSGQWMLAPTDSNGENPRPDLRPNVVSNSWGGGGGDDFYREVVNAWVAAGIFPVFASGNAGSFCSSTGSPGDYPESYGVGAYDINNIIADFSSRGPSAYGIIKPNISAPGVDVRSAVPGNGYDWFNGTSMATPHVAGAVALLWSAAPAALGDIELTRELLGASAIDHDDTSCGGDAGNNNAWGEGQMDIVAALEMAPIGPTGYLAGTITTEGGAPIVGATVGVTGPANRNTSTDATGAYRMRLPIGSYAVEARAFGYLPSTAPDVAIEQDATTSLDLALAAAPSFVVSGTVFDAGGLPLAGATVRILATPLTPATTDEDGAFTFPAVPVGEYTLSASAGGCYADSSVALVVDSDEALDLNLAQKTDGFGYQCSPTDFNYLTGDTWVVGGDDDAVTVDLPFTFNYYGRSTNTISISTNGFVSLEPSTDYVDQIIPTSFAPNGAVFAFWDDLVAFDVLTGEYGTAPNRQFVIEWRDATFFDDSSQTVSFEIILNESGEIITQYASAESSLARGASASVGIENPTGTDGIQYSYHAPVITTGTAVLYEVPFAGFAQGTVIDANDGLPISGATILATAEDGREIRGTTDSTGQYRMMMTQGIYDLTVTKGNYTTGTATIEVVEDETVTQNFSLGTAKAVVTPPTIQLVLGPNSVRNRTLTLGNEGGVAMHYEILETGGGRQTTVSTAKRARRPNADTNATTTRELYADTKAAATKLTPSSAGDIISSFETNLGLGWGIGQGDGLWLSDINTVQNVEFTTDGELTGRSVGSPWAGDWAGDMAFDSTRNLMCQLAVGGDNGIHCWDQASGDVVVELVGSPWANISQRGLAYNETDDTFYVGGWNEGILYHVAGASHGTPGAVLSSCSPSDGNISGLAYNSLADVVWAATNSDTDTIYQLNPNDCTVLATLAPPQGGGFQGAGLEMDLAGNLWVVAQSPNRVYLVDSGVPGGGGDIPWLTVTPTSGEIAPGGQQAVQVSINTAGLTPGLYLGTLFVTSNSARSALIRVPVSLVVSGYLQGVNAGGNAYTDANGDAWARDQAHRNGGWGYVQRGSTASTRHAISGTTEDALYQDLRENPYAYRYDNVPNGVYEIDFRFAELDRVRLGARLFDGIVENTLVLPAHDIQYEVGRYAADDQRFFVEVTDGRLDVRLVPRAGSRPPVLNALRVIHRPDR